jgi:hypothetical protein
MSDRCKLDGACLLRGLPGWDESPRVSPSDEEGWMAPSRIIWSGFSGPPWAQFITILRLNAVMGTRCQRESPSSSVVEAS